MSNEFTTRRTLKVVGEDGLDGLQLVRLLPYVICNTDRINTILISDCTPHDSRASICQSMRRNPRRDPARISKEDKNIRMILISSVSTVSPVAAAARRVADPCAWNIFAPPPELFQMAAARQDVPAVDATARPSRHTWLWAVRVRRVSDAVTRRQLMSFINHVCFYSMMRFG